MVHASLYKGNFRGIGLGLAQQDLFVPLKLPVEQAPPVGLHLSHLIVIGVAAPAGFGDGELRLELVVGLHAVRVQISKVELPARLVLFPDGACAEGDVRRQPPTGGDVELGQKSGRVYSPLFQRAGMPAHRHMVMNSSAITPQSPFRLRAPDSAMFSRVKYGRMKEYWM